LHCDVFCLIFTVTNKNKTMKTYIYSYDGLPITKDQFEKNVPKNWEKDVNEFGVYSYGYYKAKEIEKTK